MSRGDPQEVMKLGLVALDSPLEIASRLFVFNEKSDFSASRIAVAFVAFAHSSRPEISFWKFTCGPSKLAYMYPPANCFSKFGAIFIITVYCTASARSAFSFSDLQLSGSQSWFKNLPCGPHQGFEGHHDLLHQGKLSILSVWRVSTVYQSPCLCSVGFLHGSD